MIELNEAQRQQVGSWLAEGLKLAEVQTRLESEFDLRLTYMEVKMLVSQLEMMPRDPDLPVEPESDTLMSSGNEPAAGSTAPPAPPSPAPDAIGGNVSVSVDQLARPGMLVSGQATFSDGQTSSWYVDQSGRLGLAPTQQGYRPSAADMQQFQASLEQELARMGM